MLCNFPKTIDGFRDRQVIPGVSVSDWNLNDEQKKIFQELKNQVKNAIVAKFQGDANSLFKAEKLKKNPFYVSKDPVEESPHEIELEKVLSKMEQKSKLLRLLEVDNRYDKNRNEEEIHNQKTNENMVPLAGVNFKSG